MSEIITPLMIGGFCSLIVSIIGLVLGYGIVAGIAAGCAIVISITGLALEGR